MESAPATFGGGNGRRLRPSKGRGQGHAQLCVLSCGADIGGYGRVLYLVCCEGVTLFCGVRVLAGSPLDAGCAVLVAVILSLGLLRSYTHHVIGHGWKP